MKHNPHQLEQHVRSTQKLVTAVQELSLARALDTVLQIVRSAARELTGADGATFVLREGQYCYYAEENAISPLWKGRRFPLTDCVSGWTMIHQQAAIIPDIYNDPRIPIDAYRPTFVKSLVMVPIRTEQPIGAIGNYWANYHLVTESEVQLLQALADSTSIALEHVQLYNELEQRVLDRTLQLEAANRDLAAFSYAVAHDLRSPLSRMLGFSEILIEDYRERLEADGQQMLEQIKVGSLQMSELVDDILRLSHLTQSDIQRIAVNLSDLVTRVVKNLRHGTSERKVTVQIAPDMIALGDARLLRVVFENLLSNAWKFTSRRVEPQIEIGYQSRATAPTIYYVRDNGIGFDMQQAGMLFSPFQRMQTAEAFAGHGVGLSTVQRIIHKHGGRLWAESALEAGATFFFTLEPESGTRPENQN